MAEVRGRRPIRGDDNGGSLTCGESSIPVTIASLPEKLEKVVGIMNLAAKKMHELKGVLFQESIVSSMQLEAAEITPLVTRFSKQIQRVDALLQTNCNTSCSSLKLKKEKYHYFFEELEDFNFGIGKDDIHDLFNQTNTESEYQNSRTSEGGTTEINNNIPCQYEPAKKDSSAAAYGYRHRSLTPVKSSELMEKYDGRRANWDFPIGLSDEDEIDARHSNKHKIYNASKKFTQYPNSVLKTSPEASVLFNEVTGKTNDPMKGKTSTHLGSKSSLSPALIQSQISEESDSFESLSSELPEAVESVARKVVRQKPKPRPRVQDLFPRIEQEGLPLSASRRTQSPTTLPFISGGDYLDTHDCGGTELEEVPWANKSKSANESWYEFKERCSATSLQQLLLTATPSPTRQTTSASSSKFLLKDYMHAAEQALPTRSSVKNVRFSSSPVKSSSGPFPFRSSSKEYFDSDLSSSDDEPRFDVKQFPCRSKTRGFRRTQGSSGILKYK